jgi:hypothetical protein
MAQTGVLINEKQTTYFKNPNVDWLWCEGAEMVTNGDDHIGTIAWTGGDPDDWTVVETGATADVAEDAEGISLTSENGVQVASIYQDVSLNPNNTYIFKATVETATSGTLIVGMGQDPAGEAVVGNMGMSFTTAVTQTRIGKPDNVVNTGINATAKATGGATVMIVSTISVKPMLSTFWPQGRRVNTIEFWPGANGDICIFRDGFTTYAAQGDTSAPACFHVYEATDLVNTFGPKNFNGQRMKLFLDTANSTMSDGSRIIINWAE